MSSVSPNGADRRVSKVTFQPINQETLVVSIRTVVPSPGDGLNMEPPRRSESLDSKKRSRTHRSLSLRSIDQSTMTDYRKEISVASQTNLDNPNPHSSVAEHKLSPRTPCLKHAAENIALKATDLPSEKLSLCNNCSKSMLSYIFVVQDFLDSLAKEICVGDNSQDCTQCLREKAREQIISRSEEAAKTHYSHGVTSPSGKEASRMSPISDIAAEHNREKGSEHEYSKPGGDLKFSGKKKSNRTPEDRRKKNDKEKEVVDYSNATPTSVNNSQRQPDSLSQNSEQKFPDVSNQSSGAIPTQTSSQQQEQFKQQAQQQASVQNQMSFPNQNYPTETASQNQPQFVPSSQGHDSSSPHQEPNVPTDKQHFPASEQPRIQHQQGLFVKPMERQQPNYDNKTPSQYNDGSDVNVHHVENVSSPLGDEVGRIIPPLSNTERDVYDSARNGAGWEGLTETHDRLVSSDGRILSEAFVTMCRNNAEALGCLVVGTSLLLTQTTRTLCVLVSDGVSTAFREPLSSIFHVVQTVRSLDTLGTTKLALLEQPELGISFDKLNVWRLTQFQKCVYLNPDTLVIQNCDELFNRKELSAVPDIGWPDCFNSGVFVFAPSSHTFWQLLDFSDKQGSFDGGDQGLLNSYFSSWSSDISNKLSFIYNLMANVSYTYTPAFKQFGHNVKIVQFHGSFKPWHVKYFSHSGEISPASAVHPNYEQFVKKWIKMFQGSALRQLTQEIQSYAASQKVICAVELLRFFPLPSESEAEFFLTPPSVRLRLAEMKLNRTSKFVDDAKRRKSAEFPRRTSEDRSKSAKSSVEETKDSISTGEVEDKSEVASSDSVFDSPVPRVQSKDTKDSVEDENKLPGAEVGNYQGMKKWEQGKMDYQGTDSSDSILKRLEFLMSQPK